MTAIEYIVSVAVIAALSHHRCHCCCYCRLSSSLVSTFPRSSFGYASSGVAISAFLSSDATLTAVAVVSEPTPSDGLSLPAPLG